MISKGKITIMVRKISSGSEKKLRSRIIHPVRDWTYGILLALVLFILFSSFAGFTYYSFSKNVDKEINVESSAIIYEQKDAQAVLEIYRERKIMFEKLREDKSNVVIIESSEEMESDEEE